MQIGHRIYKHVGLQLKHWNRINEFVQSRPSDVIYSRPLHHYSSQTSLIFTLPSHDGYVQMKVQKIFTFILINEWPQT